jgi:hypothetical protein
MRWSSDVLDAVRGPDDREQQQRRGEIRPRSDEGDREAPERERDAHRRGQASSLERDRREGADQAAGSECGSEVADRPGRGVEQAEDGNHDEDVQAAADEALSPHQRSDQPHLARLTDDA